jgi:uncharacterized protein YjbI with pentapeptide repeats
MVDPRDRGSVWWQTIGARAREHRLWWRRQRRGGGRISLQGENLCGAKLSELPGLRLADCDLSRSTLLADLRDLELIACRLDDVVMLGDLSGSRFAECSGERLDLRRSRQTFVHLEDCAFVRSSFVCADLTSLRAKRCDFSASDLTDATFRDATFHGCSFRNAILGGDLASLEGTRFVRCDFIGVAWHGRRLRGVTFDRCGFHGCHGAPNVDGPFRVIAPDFSAEFDGSDLGGRERFLQSFQRVA